MIPVRLAAIAAHRLVMLRDDFLAEYRKLDGPREPDSAPGRPPGEVSCTAASTELAASWDHDQRQPVTAARFGFSVPTTAATGRTTG
jgi:hypothetical protein